MSMHGLKHYLHAGADDAAVRRAVSLLMSGIADCAVEANPDECESFRHQIGRLQVSAENAKGTHQLVEAIEAAVHALQSYHSHLTSFIQTQGANLDKLTATLARTSITFSSASERAAASLYQI